MHFLLTSRHQHNLLVESDVTGRTHPGEMDSGTNRECWRAWKNPGWARRGKRQKAELGTMLQARETWICDARWGICTWASFQGVCDGSGEGCQRRTFQSTHFKDNPQNPFKSHQLVKSPPWNFLPSEADSLLCQRRAASWQHQEELWKHHLHHSQLLQARITGESRSVLSAWLGEKLEPCSEAH